MKFKIEQYERCDTMNAGSIEDHLIGITKPSIDRMLKMENPADCIALYTFYCYTRKWQKNNAVFATSDFAMKALSWGRDKFSKAKSQLKDAGFIEDIQRKDSSGKILGWFVGVRFAQSATLGNFHTTEIPDCGESAPKYLGMVNEIPNTGSQMQAETSPMASFSLSNDDLNEVHSATAEVGKAKALFSRPPNTVKKSGLPRTRKSPPIDESFFDELRRLHPDKDVDLQKRKAETWLLAHPQRKFTRAFFANWMNRCKETINPEDEYKPTLL